MMIERAKPMANTTALVTGGGGAIGSASALEMARDGATVMIMGRSLSTLEKARDKIVTEVPDARIEIAVGDATVEEDVRSILQQAHDIAARLDVIIPLVGAGGGRGFTPLLMLDVDTFRREVDYNLISTFMAIRFGAPLMINGGSIVCISSTVAQIPFPVMAPYTSAKMAVEGLVKCAADELASLNIRVNAVRPGLTMNHKLAEMDAFAKGGPYENFFPETPLAQVRKTFGRPDDIARAVRWLAGPESEWVTGQSFAVDGGHELRRYPSMDGVMAHTLGAAALARIRRGEITDPAENSEQ